MKFGETTSIYKIVKKHDDKSIY